MKSINENRKEWYQGYVDSIVENGDYHLITLENGKGQAFSWDVFPGIKIIYYRISTDEVFPVGMNENDAMIIHYCIKGRVECEFRDSSMYYLPERHLCVSTDFFQADSVSFPLEKYAGISLKIDLEEMTDDVKRLLESFDINTQTIRKKLKLDRRCFICRAGEKIEEIFRELQVEEKSSSFLRLKVIELLQAVQEMENVEEKGTAYYPKQVIETTKKICREMIQEIDNKVTVEQIVEKYDISMVVFYKVFMQVYGDTPYSYLKKYKMNIAAGKLTSGRMKIGDIAIEMGYSNPSKFSKAFKSVYGVLPKDYRKRHMSG